MTEKIQECKAKEQERDAQYKDREVKPQEIGDRLEKRMDNLDRNWKLLEGMITTTIAQSVKQALDISVGSAINRNLAASRTQYPAIEQSKITLAQVPSGNWFIGNNVSVQPAHPLTQVVGRQAQF